MNVSVISIGNSRGILLSKTVIEKYNIKDSLELVLEKECIVLRPKLTPRKGWDKAFRKMRNNGDDKSLMPDVFKDESFEEWT